LNIKELRLVHQGLAQPFEQSASEVVGTMGAIQAQDYAGAKWALGLRTAGNSDAHIEQALSSRFIVRTWLMRGTLHFVAANDLRWMLELVAQRIINRSARRYRELELDAQTLSRSNNLISAALHDARQLNRTELLAMLQRAGISTHGQRAPHLLQWAALAGLVCQVGMRSSQPVYALLDDTIPKAQPIPRDEALAALALRYFTSRGPATLRDYIWWSGLAAEEARTGLESIKAQLKSDEVSGQVYWQAREHIEIPASTQTAHLLPAFDEYLIAYKDRSSALYADYAEAIKLGNGLSPTIAINGLIAGTWRRTIRSGRIIMSQHFFKALSNQDRLAVARATNAYGDFMGMPVVWQ
jgi:hypothetical protein